MVRNILLVESSRVSGAEFNRLVIMRDAILASGWQFEGSQYLHIVVVLASWLWLGWDNIERPTIRVNFRPELTLRLIVHFLSLLLVLLGSESGPKLLKLQLVDVQNFSSAARSTRELLLLRLELREIVSSGRFNWCLWLGLLLLLVPKCLLLVLILILFIPWRCSRGRNIIFKARLLLLFLLLLLGLWLLGNVNGKVVLTFSGTG